MNFLILSRMPDIYSTRRLVQEVISGGHTAWVKNPEIPWKELSDTTFDVLIPRLGNFRYEEALANLVNWQASGKVTVILNKPSFFHHARHKKRASEILASFPQPRIFETPSEFPLVVKDCLSSQGEGVFLFHNAKELSRCLNKLQGRDLLFQEFIQESQGRDIRVFVIGESVHGAMERVAQNPEAEFRSNLSLGGKSHPVNLSPTEQSLCIEVVRRLNLDYAGVDFVRSHRGPLILEVNPCPGLEGIEKCTERNIARDLILYAESLFNSHSE